MLEKILEINIHPALYEAEMATQEFVRSAVFLPKINSCTSFSFNSLSLSNSASMSRLRLNAAFSSLGLRLESIRCSSSAMFESHGNGMSLG